MRWPWQLDIKKSATGAAIFMQSLGRAVWTERQYDKLAEEAYVRNAIAYRCVRMIAEAGADIPWLLYEGEAELSDHPILTLFEEPNPMEGGGQFWTSVYSYLLLSGNTYIEAIALDNVVKELFSLRPDRMRVVPGRQGYPSKYVYTVGQTDVHFPVDISRAAQQPIMHHKMFHPTNDHYGLSPVDPGAYAIDVHNRASAFNKSLLDNMATPSGALVYEGENNLSDTQFARLKKEMADKYEGVRNAGRPLLLDGKLKWQELGVTPRDMEFSEGKRESARQVALAFGVPPMLLGIPGDNTYTNYAEANRALYRQTVLPMVSRMSRSLTRFLRPSFGDKFRIWYNIDEVVALSAERQEIWDRMKEASQLTINEKRAATGYETLGPDGDVVLVQSTQVSLEDINIEVEPGGEAPDDDDDDDV